MVIQIVTSVLGTVSKGLEKGSERTGNRRTIRNKSDYSIVEIGLNSEESWKPEEICWHSKSNERPSTNISGKNWLIVW